VVNIHLDGICYSVLNNWLLFAITEAKFPLSFCLSVYYIVVLHLSEILLQFCFVTLFRISLGSYCSIALYDLLELSEVSFAFRVLEMCYKYNILSVFLSQKVHLSGDQHKEKLVEKFRKNFAEMPFFKWDTGGSYFFLTLVNYENWYSKINLILHISPKTFERPPQSREIIPYNLTQWPDHLRLVIAGLGHSTTILNCRRCICPNFLLWPESVGMRWVCVSPLGFFYQIRAPPPSPPNLSHSHRYSYII
jgi:hypothetical protein